MIAITFDKNALFLQEFLQSLENLDYPKEKIYLHLTVQNATKYDLIKSSIKSLKPLYKNIKFLPSANAAKVKSNNMNCKN